jgi:hypothetical protein
MLFLQLESLPFLDGLGKADLKFNPKHFTFISKDVDMKPDPGI